ncbi:MAG: response regulator [Chloroflexi bacterium]|nr:response regulator [Chloroflexota bacterium]
MTTYPEDFEENMRDLLVNLYDYLKLIDNPVAQRLAAGSPGGDRAQTARQMVLGAIEDMKSEKDAQLTSRQNRLYNILLLRYVEEQPTNEILGQLALSERQYYREHQRAIQTISRILWDRHYADAASEPDAPSTLIQELDYLQVVARNKAFDPTEVILSAIQATRVIAEQKGLSLSLEESREEIALHVALPVFRQFFILILNRLIKSTNRGGMIEVALRARGRSPIIEVRGNKLIPSYAGFLDALQTDAAFRELKKRLNVDLRASGVENGPAGITLRFDQEIHKILIVDDNPDTISLFKRYLANLPCQLLSAQNEKDAIAIARQTPLACIILDIMLPEKDGWQILQTYKSHPMTEDIPVLICSVLEMKDLAASLGADGYIKKPPSRDEFLAVLRQWTG